MTTPPFDTVYDAFEIEMLTDAYEAITACDMWDWLRVYSPEEDKGFMFGNHPNQERINKAMKFDGHSGASYRVRPPSSRAPTRTSAPRCGRTRASGIGSGRSSSQSSTTG